ncbi:MAG: helix-turn-helix domain-containing protein [Bacillota bacterium]
MNDNERNKVNQLVAQSRKELPFTLSPKDLIKLLPYGQTKIYEMLNRNIIPCRKIEGKWIIPRDKFLEWYYGYFSND